ncbi:MAG TPA: hypothetical protein ENN22_02125 [bacterium]|nr:hypothetical protein [bacterium]
MLNKKILPLFFLMIFINAAALFSCTTAIISGKATHDGRPLLFKHRDTGELNNKLMFFTDGKYDYIGLVNSPDAEGNEVWAGVNSAGFAIMNSASYNLNMNDTTKLKDREGELMKLALQICATVDDFEALLDTASRPLGVEANFGVIDARGGAAYFETGNFDYRKFDVNDPGMAPFGYLIRTNYSFSRDTDQGFGYIRFNAAAELFDMAAATGELSVKFLLQDVSRSLKHSLIGINLVDLSPVDDDRPVMVNFRDFIPRNSSATTVVVQGVKPEESPEFATMWTILGFQLCAVATPVWVKGGVNLPSALIADQSGNAPLCDMALKLKQKCFPITRGSGKYYLNLAAVLNRKNSGIWQQLQPVEQKIIAETGQRLAAWQQRGAIDTKQVQQFYAWLDAVIFSAFQENFNLKQK